MNSYTTLSLSAIPLLAIASVIFDVRNTQNTNRLNANVLSTELLSKNNQVQQSRLGVLDIVCIFRSDVHCYCPKVFLLDLSLHSSTQEYQQGLSPFFSSFKIIFNLPNNAKDFTNYTFSNLAKTIGIVA